MQRSLTIDSTKSSFAVSGIYPVSMDAVCENWSEGSGPASTSRCFDITSKLLGSEEVQTLWRADIAKKTRRIRDNEQNLEELREQARNSFTHTESIDISEITEMTSVDPDIGELFETTPSPATHRTISSPSTPSSEPLTAPTQPARPTSGTPTQPARPTSGTPTQPARPTSGTPTQPARPTPGTLTQPARPTPGTLTQPARPTSGTPTQPARPTSGTPTQPARPTSGTPTQPARPTPGTLTQPASEPSSLSEIVVSIGIKRSLLYDDESDEEKERRNLDKPQKQPRFEDQNDESDYEYGKEWDMMKMLTANRRKKT
ncbi:hypothetical protein BLNAU_4320 [Blattamonas nauphoetae]|uniref:Uncharacterized protein n=1 Tax=Blattamonas nauphoetae TaxID=2049346 RepID=A0ABQ9YAG4_9EUKA|nr:hypothetical protein BLNAU_4320 [Blattamonas nauphoetae]